jgi:outer membrane protein assembly factor BamB
VYLALVVAVVAACGGDDTTAPTPGTASGSTPAVTSAGGSSAATTAAASPSSTATDTTLDVDPLLAEQCAADGLPSIAAFDIASGALRWLNCSTETGYRSVSGATEDLVYVVERVGEPNAENVVVPRLVAVGAGDGAPRWQLELANVDPPVAAGPVIAGNVLVATVQDTEGRAVVGLDPASGAMRWRQQVTVDAVALAATESVVVVISASPPPGWVPPDPNSPVGFFYFYGALDRASGAPLWSGVVVDVVTDYTGGVYRASVAGDTVIVPPGPVAIDSRTGGELWEATGDLGDGALGPAADGVVVWGGQDDPTSALDAATGVTRWTAPGSPPFDDVWAVGDGAVYVVDSSSGELVAYELTDGTVRWRQAFDGERYSWPWHVAGQSLFTMWTNLDVLSTVDGTPQWATNYPTTDLPRMSGAATNTTTVAVAFTTEPAG